MRVIEVQGPADTIGLAKFREVALAVYREDPAWAPASELAFERRVSWGRSSARTKMVPLVALDRDRPVARAAAILSPGATDRLGRPEGWIGFFECLRTHPDAARRVLEECEALLRCWGAKSVVAPKVDNLLGGLLTKGFGRPQLVLTSHNPPAYLDLLAASGYLVVTEMCTFVFTRRSVEGALRSPIRLPGYTTRNIDRSRLSEEILAFHTLQREIFGGRSGYVPRTLQEDRDLIESYLPCLDDDLVIFAEDAACHPVGLTLCLPDLYQASRGERIDRARIISIGAIPSLANRGIGVLMGAHLTRNILAAGRYAWVEGSLILRENAQSRNLAARFGGLPGREFALLGKTLG